jgi:hypothetical protein
MAIALNVKKLFKTLAFTAGVFLLLAIVAFFALRNYALRKVLDKATVKLQTTYQTKLTYSHAAFTGLAGVQIENLCLVPNQMDTLLYAQNIQSSIRLGYALLLDFRIKDVLVENGLIQLVKTDSVTNIDYFLHPEKTDDAATSEDAASDKQSNYAKTVYKLISRILSQVPSHLLLQACELRFKENEQTVSFNVQQLQLADEALKSDIVVSAKDFKQHWMLQGNAMPKDKKADVELFNKDTGGIRIPYITDKFNLHTGFDSIRFTLASVTLDDDVLYIKGSASISRFLINHPKISKRDVVINHAAIEYQVKAGATFIGLDSSSAIRFNEVNFHPFIQFENSPDTIVRMGIHIPKMPAQQFISSLPEGLFKHFQGMLAEGEFDYRMDFVYNENKPTDLLFESNLNKYGLLIKQYGEANLNKLNNEFVHVPIENGRPMRSILVGSANADYTPLDQISPYLKKSVLTTEDPSFFYHRGFIDEAFRQSIIKNIRKRKFARGASTISMQLVKNVFLTREKTLSRKLEEILLVYILENNRLCSKERMFEVYLNIIEWGPNVYGIGEASRFYFNKKPSELTLGESLFLATIIPRPKGFMWRFDKQGNLKDFVGRQFKFLSDLMIRRTVLMPEDTMNLTHLFPIPGKAKEFIKLAPDTNLIDTIMSPDGILGDDAD